MFGVLSKIAGYVWGSTTDERQDRAGSDYKSHSGRVKTQNRFDNGSFETKTETPNLNRVCTGKITHLYDGSGIIDNDIYFTFDLVLGGYRPELGDKVHVNAKRERETAGWKAVRVEVMSEWNTDNVFTGRNIETFVGSITKLSTRTGVVNEEIKFDFSCLRPGYIPYQGDWVKLDIERPSDGVVEVKSVTPLREKPLTGRITNVSPGFGYIDDEVYFGIGACSRNYRPRRGDVVNATAIESHQGRVNWRALKVELKKNLHHSKARNVTSSQTFMGKITAALVSDKEGVTITNPIDFGDILVGNKKVLSIWIRNEGVKSHIFLSCSSLRDDGQFTVYLADEKTAVSLEQVNNHSLPKNNKKSKSPQSSLEEILQLDSLLSPGAEISPGEAGRVVVLLQAKSLGRASHLIVFNFQGFEIGRHLLANVKDPQEISLMPNSPYERSRRRGKYETALKVMNQNDSESWVIPGERPTRKKKVFFPIKLKMYTIPRDIRRCILEDGDLTRLIPALGEPLTMNNYQAKFSTLLFAEELQQEMDMREFDLERVLMNACGEYLSLAVPGLAEGRPSLLIGDKVEVTLTGAHAGAPKYEGYIHEVRQEDILLKFHDDFHNKFGMQECDVMFFFNRATIRRAHQAVEFSANLGEEVLFPKQVSPKFPVINLSFSETSEKVTPKGIKQGQLNKENASKEIPFSEALFHRDCLYNSNLNERQQAAVTRILGSQCRPTPYVLFGPPGTGKTVTLVEAILQVFHRIPSSRILACAPSNSASDLIAQRLHQSGFIQEGDMVRLNALQRGQEVPEIISQYCTDTDDLVLAAHYRIVICTCSTSGQLFSLGLKSGHFTHVFVDEAGQATEPECLIPVGLAAGGEGQVRTMTL